jgi:hypothetical protein
VRDTGTPQHHLVTESSRPTSYDSGYEHSLEHWIELQQLLHAADDILSS